jgi:hypothetical protein
MPSGWSGDIANAFFSDPTNATLRSPDEIRSRWQNLSSQQQVQVRQGCSNMMASNNGSSGTMAQKSTGQSSGGSTMGSSSGRSTSGSSANTENLTTGSTRRLKGASSDAKSGSPDATGSDSNQMGSASGGAAGAGGSSAQMASLRQLCSTIQGM